MLLDEGVIVAKGLPGLQNLASILMALEKGESPSAVEQTIDKLLDATAPEQLNSLQMSFMTWLKQVLLPGRLKGITHTQCKQFIGVKENVDREHD